MNSGTADTLLAGPPPRPYNQTEIWLLNGLINGSSPIVCYAPSMITTNGIWQGDNPLNFSLPMFIMQLMIIVIVNRFLIFILKPLHQPRIVSEILSGLLLGPTFIGSIDWYASKVFPLRSIMVLKTMANVGLLYFLFLVGVEMDITSNRRIGQLTLIISVTSMALPLVIGVSTAYIFSEQMDLSLDLERNFVFIGLAISFTTFPMVTRILAELKLLNTNIGRLSMSSSVISDICAWLILAVTVTFTAEKAKDPGKLFGYFNIGNTITNRTLAGFYAVLFISVCIFLIRPAIKWIIKRTPEGENFNDFYICLILAGVMISGFLTDAMGTHPVFGAFLFGLIIPNGPLGTALIEKLEDFVTTLLLPLFFATSGLRTNLNDDTSGESKTSFYATFSLLIVLSSTCKVVGTLLVALLHDMPLREGLSLGLLMNTRGLMEMIVLNIGRDLKILKPKMFSCLVIATMLITSITAPTVLAIHKPGRRFVTYKRRTIQKSKGDAELRIVVCIHTPRNVPTMINLLEASHPTKKSPICIYALHLVELTGRASAMLIVHSARKTGLPAINRTQAQSEHIINAFDNYAQHTGNVIVLPLTAVSPYPTMHEDICNLAEDKRVTLIIIPFHKQQTVDGGMEATNPAFRGVNQNVLANAPCSVAILIDRGLGGSAHVSASHIAHHIAVLFIGGPDDREALSYAWRMAENPNINLTVMRFVLGDNSTEPTRMPSAEDRLLTVITDNERENQLDEEYISDFRLKTVSNETIMYKEKVVNNSEETVSSIREMDNIHDLYVVGRGRGITSPLTEGLTDWSECPELGAIGDLLASADFASTMSVLVVQQYIGEGVHGDGLGTPKSPAYENYLNNDMNH